MNTHQNPLASVILPVYNAEKYLESAIASVLNQSFTDFELLLLNDGSTDGSLNKLQRIAASDQRCKLHTWPNKGLVATLNEGMQLARGDIIFRMDADDISHPERFKKQIDYLHDHSDCVAVGSKVLLVDSENCPITVFDVPLEHQAIDSQHLSGNGAAICHPVAALRKSALLSIGGYRTEFTHAEDIDMFLRLAEVGYLANLPEVLLDYRQHMNSIGYKHALDQRKSIICAQLSAYERRGTAASGLGAISAVELDSTADVHKKWAWWALSAGNLSTSRKHAFKALLLDPLNLDTLKVCVCAIRGH